MLTLVGKRRVLWDPTEQINEEEPVSNQAPLAPPEIPAPVSPPLQAIVPEAPGKAMVIEPKTTRAYKQREGNGHTVAKTRNLLDSERDQMKKFFTLKDGRIEDNDCVEFREACLTSDVTIFQVTGFISVLHNDVAEGQIQLKDLPSYEQWMRTKYGGLWARYNNPMYVTVRKANQAMVEMGQKPTHYIPKEKKVKVWATPKFSPLPRKRW